MQGQARTPRRPVSDLLGAAMPSGVEAAAGSAGWAAGMALTAVVSLWLGGWATAYDILRIGLLFAAGGGLAFAPALFCARLLSRGRPSGARFSAAFLSLAATTMVLTALLYAVQHRLTFDEDHAEPFTADWVLELAFATAAAFYRFALFGLPLYFPLGLLFLFLVTLLHARRPR